MAGPTATSYLVAHLVDTLGMHGFDASQALVAADIDEAPLANPDHRIPVATVFQFWRAVEDITGDPLFGLKTAANVGAGYPVFRHLLSNSPNLSVAYDRWCGFYRLISDAAVIRLEPDANTPMLVCEPVSEALPGIGEDWTVGQWLTLGRHLVGQDWQPKALWLTHSDNGCAEAYQNWFSAPITFDADCAAMALSEELMELTIPGADATLLDVLDQHVTKMIAQLPTVPTAVSAVRALLTRRVSEGRANHAGVAAELAMSERTLQRRLSREGTTLKQVFAKVRRDMAKETLADPDISIGETAFLLGFSESSAFHRAFKRWTGVTPTVYRSKRLEGNFGGYGQ